MTMWKNWKYLTLAIVLLTGLAAAPTYTSLFLSGSTSGTLQLNPPAIASGTITFPAGTTDFSATGGTSQFVKQVSTGAPLTVVRPACADLSDAGAGCSGSSVSFANPSATAGPTANNGSASTAMRSDASPAVQLATAAQKGIVQGDGSTLPITAGVIACATTTSSQSGCGKPDGQTIVAAAGVLSTSASDVTKTANYSIAATDMGGQVNCNGSGITITIPAISSTVLAANMSVTIMNIGSVFCAISSTPTINGFAGTTVAPNTGIYCLSNGVSLDCFGLGGPNNPVTYSNGTVSSGTATIECRNGVMQSLTNGGAFTFAMSSNDGQCTVRVTNNGSAGAITFSGFSQGTNSGDALTTTNTNKFDIVLSRIGGNPHYLVSALQ